MLIKSYHERMRKSEEKKRKILRFLRDETWTSLKNIMHLIGIEKNNAFKTLTAMKHDCLIHTERYKNLGGIFYLYGITAHGLAMSYDEDECMSERYYFEPSKVSISTVNHTLDIQFARIKAENSGWTQWINGKYLEDKNPLKRPDAVAINPKNEKIAIEVERTIKTKKRYEQVIATYLQAIKKGEYNHVIYLSPPEVSKNLERHFRQVKEIPLDGHRVEIGEKHHEKFKFFSLDHWLQKQTAS